MKDLIQVFDDSFAIISKTLDQENYAGAANYATDLLTMSLAADYREGVFIGETFENIFNQLDSAVSSYTVDDSDRNTLREGMKAQLNLVAKSYKQADKNELFASLQDMRFMATQFQFKCFRFLKPKPDLHVSRGFLGRRR